MKKLRWGVLGAAKIATRKVIPAMQQASNGEVTAIASRDLAKAQAAAAELNIPRVFGSYEEMLADPDIDAVYNPLPNHLHVPLTVKAAEAGKHVLCEKPVALNAAQAHTLIAVRDRTGVQISEAFMVRTHPQWLRAREIVRSGEIGRVSAIQGFFSYFNRDPQNVRNVLDWGGGGVMDIGCYPITMSRFIFEDEPRRVAALVERDPDFKVDRLSSALLDFPQGQASFVCSTQLAPYQRMHIFGPTGRIEVLIPWNAPPDVPTKIIVETTGQRVEEFPVCDQYTLQAEQFARAVWGEGELAVTLENSVKNMAVIDAVLKAGATGNWETPLLP